MPIRLRPWFLSAATGLLLVAAFPKWNLGFLAWVALVPLLLVLERASRLRAAFGLGYLCGVVFFAGTIYWVRLVMLEFGGLGEVAAAGVLLLFAAVLACFFGAFAALARLLLALPDRHILWGLPALWVALEFVRAHLFTGFPWLLLGYALAEHLLPAQLARLGGVYLLSFVVVLFNTGILLVTRKPTRRRGMALAAAFLVLAAASLGGSLLPTPEAPETAYLVQAEASLAEEWTVASVYKLLADLEVRVLATYARNQSRSGLVLWPEIPASFYYYDDPPLQERLHRLARLTQSYHLVNVIAFADAERKEPLNSAVLISPGGELLGRYDKIHLVPFGEYVPLKKLFFFAGKLTAEVGDFVPGTRPVPLGERHPLAALICYEGIFPDLVRQFSAGGAELLVNLSNDSWYGDSAARYQLLLMSRMRAIENGRWLLRATNTGITAIVDPYGRLETFPPDRRAVFTGKFGYLDGRTPYVAFGHWFPVLAAAAVLGLLLKALWFKKRQGAKEAAEEAGGAPP